MDRPTGQDRRLFEVLVIERKDESVGLPVQPVAGAADPLQEATGLVGGAELDDVVDEADIDAELEGGGRDEAAELPVPELLLRLLADLAGERPVVNRNGQVRGEPVESRREPLGGRPGVDEDEGRPVRPDRLFEGAERRELDRVGP